MYKYKTSKLIKTNKINSDKRGYFDSMIDDEIQNLSFLYSHKNTMRSNHYHLKDYHYIYVIKGSIHYFYKKLKSKEIKYLFVDEGKVIFTPPLEIHATFFNQNTSMIVANNLSRKKQSYENDLIRENLIDIEDAKKFIRNNWLTNIPKYLNVDYAIAN